MSATDISADANVSYWLGLFVSFTEVVVARSHMQTIETLQP